ncbi:MAG: histidine kinase dimerization/phospho-acceptor domain-containing protein [Kiritimatiellae bacterium]|nr:histidine kinase dimerization/phospho-acceptor domain-containing protein [Kiritimatiellia bacterium]
MHMKLFPKGARNYAILLVVLFSIAAIATWQVIDFTTERFLLPDQEHVVHGFGLAVWALTMGLMFLSGALGLLAISATAECESRHRIARIINRMNYLADGLLALDYQGRIEGINSAARNLSAVHVKTGKRLFIREIFPSLTEENAARLLHRASPAEIESESVSSSGLRMLRFRSQPVEGLILVLVSDITEMHAEHVRRQQTAKLQLLGRIAGGVAHDFSNILSAISGHASLMQRFGGDQRTLHDSIGVILSETQRGVQLSRQLLVLSRSPDYDGQSSANLSENVSEAGKLLCVALSSAWIVKTEIAGVFPVVPLSPSQIVQIVLNLGLLAADALKKPGKITIELKPPDDALRDARRFAAVITMVASANNQTSTHSLETGAIDTTGIIPSVVRALVEEAGGRLDELYAAEGKSVYKICLPRASRTDNPALTPVKSIIKGSFRLKQWRILLVSAGERLAWLAKMLADLGAVVDRKTTVEAAFSFIDQAVKPDVIIADRSCFGEDAAGLLKAVRKICPVSGMIIVSPRAENEDLRNEDGFVFLEPDSSGDTWLDAVVNSISLAPPQK